MKGRQWFDQASRRWVRSRWNPIVLTLLVGLNLTLFVLYDHWWSLAGASLAAAVCVYVVLVMARVRQLEAETAAYDREAERLRRLRPDFPWQDEPPHPRRLL